MRPSSIFAAFFVIVFSATLIHITIYPQSRVNSIGNGGIHTIQGRIYLPNGRTVDRPLKVKLESLAFATDTVYSDHNGFFAFRSLVPGNYTVVVDAGEAFAPAREAILIEGALQTPVGSTSSPKTMTVPIHLQIAQSVRLRNEVIDSKLADVPKAALEHFRRAVELSSSSKSDEAIREFREALSYFPSFTPCYVEMGKTYLKINKLDEAINSLQTALKYEPNDFDARLNLGIALLNGRRFDDAEKELVTAAYINRSAVTPHYYIGVMYIEKKDLDIAQKALETAKELTGDKSFPLLHKYLGGVYIAKDMEKPAARELEMYLEQDPNARDADRIRKTISELKKKR